jgi:hypothetical protein
MLRQSARWTIPWLAIKSQIIREWSELDGIGVRVADIEPGFVCRACGKRGARLRPDFNRTAVRAERPAFLVRAITDAPLCRSVGRIVAGRAVEAGDSERRIECEPRVERGPRLIEPTQMR